MGERSHANPSVSRNLVGLMTSMEVASFHFKVKDNIYIYIFKRSDFNMNIIFIKNENRAKFH